MFGPVKSASRRNSIGNASPIGLVTGAPDIWLLEEGRPL